MNVEKCYNYKNLLIWKMGNGKYIIESIGGEFSTLMECKNIIKGRY